MDYALSVKKAAIPIDPVNLLERPVTDITEQESFYVTIKDSIKRGWFARVRFFKEVNVNQLKLAPFEYPEAFYDLGEYQYLDAVPLEIDEITQEITFKDIFAIFYTIEFRDIIDIELL